LTGSRSSPSSPRKKPYDSGLKFGKKTRSLRVYLRHGIGGLPKPNRATRPADARATRLGRMIPKMIANAASGTSDRFASAANTTVPPPVVAAHRSGDCSPPSVRVRHVM